MLLSFLFWIFILMYMHTVRITKMSQLRLSLGLILAVTKWDALLCRLCTATRCCLDSVHMFDSSYTTMDQTLLLLTTYFKKAVVLATYQYHRVKGQSSVESKVGGIWNCYSYAVSLWWPFIFHCTWPAKSEESIECISLIQLIFLHCLMAVLFLCNLLEFKHHHMVHVSINL